MKKILLPFLCFVLGFIPAFESRAENYGLAMHGQPKYAAEAKFLDYANPDAPKGGALKMAAIGTFDSINPFSIKGVAAEGLPLIYDRLMQRVWDEPFTLYPLIAKDYDVAEDRSWISFTLDPRARFHDGTPVTADDVLFSYETLKEHGRPNMRRVYRLVSRAEKTGDLSVKFTLGEGHDRETIMILAMMPVLSKAWWSSHDFDSAAVIPVLNGPYKIASIEPGRKITYERVKDYWAKDLLVNAGQYNFDTITYDYYRDDTIALESFKKGDLDLRREWDIGKWETGYGNLDQTKFIKAEIPHQRPERAHGMIFNLRRPPFDDLRVRKALSLAFDAEWVGKNLYHDKFKRIDSFFPNSVLDGTDEQTDSSKTSRERLKQASDLLAQAGWVVQNGQRVRQDTGKVFSFEMIVGSAAEEKIALSYQRSLERMGIQMRIRTLDSTSFQDRKSHYDYDMMMFYWQNSLSPGTEQLIYWSCATKDQEAGFNYSGICLPELDSHVRKIPDALTYEELMSTAQSIDRILMDQVISIPLFYKGSDYVAMRKTIQKPDKPPLYGFVMETLWAEPVSAPSSTK